MKFIGGARSHVHTIWLTCALVWGVGIACVWLPSSAELSNTRAHASELYEEANQNDADVRRGAELVASRARVLQDIASLRGQFNGATATAAALTLIAERARRDGIEVRSLLPQDSPTPMALLSKTEIALAIRGHFRNLIAFTSNLPRHDALIGVTGIAINAGTASKADPSVLDATLHLALYRIDDPVAKESTHASVSR